MERTLQSTFKKFDWILLVAAVALVILGLSTIQSTVVAGSSDNQILTQDLLNIQLVAVGIGVSVFLGFLFFDYRYLAYFAMLFYVVTFLSLGAVLLWGQEIRGATRWFELFEFSLQPSTVGAMLLVVSFSAFFSAVKNKINRWWWLMVSIGLLLPVFVLILIEPDLGAAVIVGLIWFGLLHMTPVRVLRLGFVYLAILIVVIFSWQSLSGYQLDRLISFSNPEQDPLGTGYNALQSVIAVGSGQWLGRGWGQGTQSHLQFLPEQHTDFIFATFAEEQGLVGSLVVVVLYGVLIWRMFVIVGSTSDYFGQLLVAGVLIWISIHVLINIGMNLGIAPVTGVPLPLLSYGGTMMVTSWVALGLVESVAIHCDK